jgi:hypothetical protein
VTVTHDDRTTLLLARRWIYIAIAATGGVLLVLVGVLLWAVFGSQADRAALKLLRAPDPQSQKIGAWLAAREDAPRAWDHIAAALEQQFAAEPPVRPLADPSVRESFAYALGRSGQPRYFDIVAHVVRDDPDPYVRQAAWIAAGRLAPERFRALAAEVPARAESWDCIGRACAWLETGDMRGVNELFHWAAAGSPEQQRIVSMALGRSVAPLLETVGDWPIETQVQVGQAWPPELVAEIAARCARLDLQTIADDLRPHWKPVAEVRRNVGRLYDTQERIARVLFWRVN